MGASMLTCEDCNRPALPWRLKCSLCEALDRATREAVERAGDAVAAILAAGLGQGEER